MLAPRAGDLAIVAPSRTTAAVFAFSTRIGGVLLRLRLHWSVRDLAWTLDVQDQSGDPIIAGLLVTVGVDLFGGVDRLRLPTGPLFCADLSGSARLPDRDAWAGTHGLYYRGEL